MKFFIYAVLLFFCQSYIFAGDPDRIPIEKNVMDMPQGALYNALTGDGYSNQFNSSIYNLTESNPASNCNFSDLSFGLSYQFSSKIDHAWDRVYNRTMEKDKLILPQSVAITAPFRELHFGIGFAQRYNAKSIIGPFETKYFTPENPTGIDTSVFLKKETLINVYSLITAYSFRNLINDTDRMDVGMNISYAYVNQAEQVWSNQVNYNFSGYLWTLGVIYANTHFNFGAYFEKGDKFRKALTSNTYIVAKFQDKLHVGFQIQDIYRLKIYGNVTRIFWHDTSINDHFEYSAGIVFKPANYVYTSFGFFTNDQKYEKSLTNPLNYDRSYDALFLTGGMKIFINQIQFDLIVANSHLFSSKFREQTLIKLAIGYLFNFQ